ncbi:hypothetical protein K6119_12330 [Paracrocinitomix mangrovi]|uniref:sensor histidine kinase n=1 Tax=Paracrocinitomix mangrovi TaxID=2862509 RepID=UPI001C8EA982|nr:histidine kinase dimerization/phosphoacceptor domain -containing protein [Paracrocinitomix mangrovi]UKN00519.1 hypothetical protein K6119_12330 [Paracrocinitomix mangrovi]
MKDKDPRLIELMEQLVAYSNLDFDRELDVPEDDDEFGALVVGLKMLGEELKANTISLQEKEQLLKELHHRVKNNMQIIVSMLRLQSFKENDPKFISLVQDSKSRIESMALVHEMLYSTEGFEFTSLAKYVDFLQRSIFMSYAPPKHQISAHISIPEDIVFNIDNMIPLGMIINELFMNSLKHAFPKSQGDIWLNVTSLTDSIKIEYADNGIGFPKDIDPQKVDSLGMQLIIMLSDQLDGKLNFESLNNEDIKEGVKISIQIDY